MEEEKTESKWYSELMSAINNFSEELGLDDFGTSKLRDFVLAKSKAQFKAGNKSGIRWAYKQMESASQS